MLYIITAAVSAFITSACFLWKYEICAPIEEEQKRPIRYQWFDFIQANINESFTKWHCYQCCKMIALFDSRFRKEIPPHIFNDYIQILYNLLDTKYKTICTQEDELSTKNIGDIIKF